MRRLVRHCFACALFSALVLVLSCGGGSPPAKAPKAIKTVSFITNNFSDFWKVAHKGCDKAVSELKDVKLDFRSNNDGTVQTQDRMVREALDNSDADAIAISPLDPAAQKALINNAAKRAVVITQDSDAPDTNRMVYIGTDNSAAGRQLGDLVKKALPQGGKIMVFVGNKDVPNAAERYQGLKDALSGSNVQIIDLMTDDSDPSQANSNASQALKQHPDLAGMVGLWSYNGPAIVKALKLSDKAGKVKVVCFDDAEDTLDGIKDGSIFGTVAQQPFEYGYQAVQVTDKILKGDKSVIPGDKKITIPTIIIQKNNLDDYRKKKAQLLGS